MHMNSDLSGLYAGESVLWKLTESAVAHLIVALSVTDRDSVDFFGICSLVCRCLSFCRYLICQ